MKTAWNDWAQSIAKTLSKQLGTEIEATEIVTPPEKKMGDFTFGCFRLAKTSLPLQLPLGQGESQNPALIARAIAENFDQSELKLMAVTALGPYVNFSLDIGETVARVIEEVEAAAGKYGEGNLGEAKQLLLEYAQMNTHKETHVGHMRNMALSAAVGKILELQNWNVVYLTYHGDVGAHVARCLWWMVMEHEAWSMEQLTEGKVDQILEKIPVENRTGKFLGNLYAESTRMMEEKGDEGKAQVSFVQQKLEAHDPVWEKLWMETRQWCVDEMKQIFQELGMKVERQYWESEVVDRGQEIVDSLLAKGVAKESQGAIVVDMEDKKMNVFLVRKSDGTSLYATKDLALAELKAKEYPDYQRSLYIVDTRQAFYFKQLFETLQRMGFDRPLEYIGYELVTLPEGAMSSRKGTIVTYQTFRDAVLEYAKKEIVERHADWSSEQVDRTAWMLAMAGIKFGMLRQDNDRVYIFDLKQALAFEGATGPYCQYAGVRLGSILRKVSSSTYQVSGKLTKDFDHQSEKNLALALAVFPLKVEQAAKELRPAIIAQWCLETAQYINDFYRDVPILQSEGDLLSGRLRFAAAARSVLAQGLELLGIAIPDQM